MNWMHYLVEANLYMAAFYALYLLFLRSETHYQLNRAYLLSTSLLAFIIPFVQLGMLKPVAQASAQISVGSLSGSYAVVLDPAPAPRWTFDDYILLIYGLVAIVLLINLCIRIYLLMALLKKGSITQKTDFNIIELSQGSVAFSFFNNLFIDDRLASSQTILYHEQVHIRQKHSWDIIYLEFLKIINWFNPVVYLLIASIKEVHEFIADEATAGLENNNDSYTDFLISNAYGITQNSLTNSFFNKNLLKRRITMLYQKKSGKAARLKYLLTLPLIAGLLCLSTLAFTTKTYGLVDLARKPVLRPDIMNAPLPAPVVVKHPKTTLVDIGKSQIVKTVKPQQPGIAAPPSDKPAEEHSPVIVDTSKVFTSADRVPEFIGGEASLAKFLQQNIHYPIADKQNNIQGRVYVQFVVERDGSLNNIKVLRSPSDAMGDESIRVMQLSPRWKPGTMKDKPVRVEFTLPINFSLSPLQPPLPPAKHSGNAPLPPPPPSVKPDGSNPTVPLPEVKVGGMLSLVKLDGNNPNILPPPPVNKIAPGSHPNAIYTTVEAQPEFPGGETAFGKFLQQTIHYPATAKQNKIQGRVYVQFVVEKDGSITDIKVLREPGSGIGDEAVRVLKLSPKWVPGKLNGQTVRVQFTLPIEFTLGA